jgi:uncharacterized membrane protein YecN with MAPEG domain
MINIEVLGWFTTLLLWSSLFPKNRFYLHLIGLFASIGRLLYILVLYCSSTGDLARPLIANWIVMIIIHIISLYRFRSLAKQQPEN